MTELGCCRFDLALTPVDAIERAAYSLSEVLSIEYARDASSPDILVCVIHPRAAERDARDLAHLFRVEVNDQVLRVRIARETAPVRDLIFAVAFSRTGLIADAAGE